MWVSGSAAQAAGIMEGDQIVAFNGQQLAFFDQFVDSIPAYKGREIQLSALRDGQEMEFTVAVPEEGKIGVYPKINEGYFELSTTRYNMAQAIPAGWNKAVKTLKNYIRQFKVIFNPDTEASINPVVHGPRRLGVSSNRVNLGGHLRRHMVLVYCEGAVGRAVIRGPSTVTIRIKRVAHGEPVVRPTQTRT